MMGEGEKQAFPFSLDSWKGNISDDYEQLVFHNYYPKSGILNKNVKRLAVNNEYETQAENIYMKMKEMSVESMIAKGKINIYPKKNTIDLKKHFGKRMNKIEKKTQKAILQLAKEQLKKKNVPAQ